MRPFAVLMFVFAELLFVAAGLLYRGHTGWLLSFDRAKVKDKEAYAKFLAVCVIGCGIAILIGSAVSLVWNTAGGAIVMAAGILAVLAAAARKSKDHFG